MARINLGGRGLLNFEIDYTGAQKVQDALNGLGEAFSPQERDRILRKIAVDYLHETESRFEKQYDPDRKKWKPLTKTTLRIKSKKGSLMGAAHIGVWTGKLASSLQYVLRGDTVSIGTNVRHGPWFHYGTKDGWGPVPSRRFLGRNTRIDQKILRTYENEIRKRIGFNLVDVESAA